MLRSLAPLLTFLLACGGEAVIDPPLAAGGAGGSQSSGTTTVTGTGTSVSTNGSTGVSTSTGIMDVCETACTSLAACSVMPADFECAPLCHAANEDPACGRLHDDFITCALGEIGSLCGSVPAVACASSLNAWLTCTDIVVQEGCAVGPQGTCNCEALVSPGIEYSQSCTPGQGCTCLVGGLPLGSCEPNDELCGISDGCCSGFFFTAPF